MSNPLSDSNAVFCEVLRPLPNCESNRAKIPRVLAEEPFGGGN